MINLLCYEQCQISKNILTYELVSLTKMIFVDFFVANESLGMVSPHFYLNNENKNANNTKIVEGKMRVRGGPMLHTCSMKMIESLLLNNISLYHSNAIILFLSKRFLQL